MIPKIIHYCWFGQGEMNEITQNCIESWKKYLPDYEFKVWNESNFDINMNDFVKEAYDQKKFAFVSDFVRLYALKEYGGIYMDTDVEVVKSLDPLLNYNAFTGVETGEYCVTGTMGAIKDHPWINKLLDYYSDKKFVLPNGKLAITPNTVIITEITKKEYNWKEGNKVSTLSNGVVILPFDYLCAKNGRTNEIMKTANTYTIHHFNGSWRPLYKRILSKYVRFLRKVLGLGRI